MRAPRSVPLVLLGLLAARCGGGDGPAETLQGSNTVTLQTVQSSIFSPTCAVSGCHLAPDAPFGLDLSQGRSLGNTRDVASSEAPSFDRIEPGDPANSYLYMKVTADPRISGDAMPAEGAPLTASQLDVLRRWIEQGANP